MYQKSLNESITFLFIGQGQVDTWHHLRGIPNASSSKNLERIHFRMSLNNFAWCISLIFVFLKHFAWLYEITFTFPLYAAAKLILFHFTWLCKNFAWSCEIEKHVFSTPFCNFSHFFIFNPPPPPSIKLQSLVQMHFLFIFIHIVYPPPFHFPFVTLCFKNHLKISPKLNKKTISISCKGSNVLLGYIRHNYYSKGMKLMKISI